MFKIHSIVLTKNEADVIELCLAEAARWSDHIYVYDGASTDGTWDIVQSLARTHPQVIPWRQDGKVFSEGLRAEVFGAFRHQSREGDWWLQLNADEFYDQDPHEFLARVPARHHLVWGIPIQYYITDQDLRALDFNRPFERVRDLLRYYQAHWSEPRCFRYRRGLIWSTDAAWPRHAGPVARERIYFKHYPYRSPQQIQVRLDVRRNNRARGFEGWQHASQSTWEEKIVLATECSIDDGSGGYQVDEAKLPRHLEPLPRRWVKLLLHGLGVWP